MDITSLQERLKPGNRLACLCGEAECPGEYLIEKVESGVVPMPHTLISGTRLDGSPISFAFPDYAVELDGDILRINLPNSFVRLRILDATPELTMN